MNRFDELVPISNARSRVSLGLLSLVALLAAPIACSSSGDAGRGAGGAQNRAGTTGIGGGTSGASGSFGGSSGAIAGSAGQAGAPGGLAGSGGAAAGGVGGAGSAGATGSGGTTGLAGAGGGSSAGGSAGAAGSTGGGVARPSYNTGKGFFVLNGKLYDKNGVEFHIRGMNKLHWDFGSSGMWNTNANTIRFDIDFDQPSATNLGIMNDAIAHHMVPMPGNWDGTCKSESALAPIVATWVSQAATWQSLDDKIILNIANELGPDYGSSMTAWRDAYVSAVKALRAAGYKCTIAVDSGGCGQDAMDIVNGAQAIMDADPEHNVIFDVHVYGYWDNSNLASDMDKLKNTGLPILLGEFGPGNNVGPSPTTVTPTQVINAADSRNFGWLAWAWDDDPAGSANGGWFALCKNSSLDYNSSADLTAFGVTVIESPTIGLKAKAVKQTAY